MTGQVRVALMTKEECRQRRADLVAELGMDEAEARSRHEVWCLPYVKQSILHEIDAMDWLLGEG